MEEGSMLLWQPGASRGPQPWLLAFHAAFGDPPHTQQACPLEAVGSTQGTAAATGVGWKLAWVSSEV